MEEKDTRQLPETPEGDSAVQHEDVAMKTTMHFFADELLPYLGIEGKVVSIAPTESIHLEVKKLFEDFNLVMEDGSWKHFEFQSTNEGLEGLKRFRVYEALTSYQHKVSVTTYVLFSGKIQNPMTAFTEGSNTYRIIPIILKGKNADKLLRSLQEKVRRGETLTKKDLVPLTLCLLMGGEMNLKDRVKTAYEITREAVSVKAEDIRKIEAVLYLMAEKFLGAMEMNEVKEELKMTRLGQMLVEDGRAEGIIQGKAEEKREIAKNLIGLLDDGIIAERTGLPIETIRELKEEVTKVAAK